MDARFGGPSKCARCNKGVYSNEEVIAAGKSWHKRGCFTCATCNKSLDSNTVAEKKDEEQIYCKSCYCRKYGPKGFGYGGGAGALTHPK